MIHDEAFAQVLERHRRELRLHCYRMLGSSHDSDDVVQEALLRAWRAKETLKEASRARAWLYRIATNTCLDELARRPSRRLASDAGPPGAPGGHATEPHGNENHEAWLEPCPDTWLDGLVSDPAARLEAQQGVALAFVAALQCLTPVQRATLLLRDVVGLSADETSRALDMSLAAANSALFRARTAVDERLGGRDPGVFAGDAGVDEDLLSRYIRAWQSGDVAAFVTLLHDDVVTTMPPSPRWVAGLAANIAFYRPMFASLRVELLLVHPVGANGQPALAFYRADSDGEPKRLRAIHVLEPRAGRVARIDHFMLPALFPVFGLSSVWSSERDEANAKGQVSAI